MTPQLKRLAVFLALSVALNLVLAGFLIGRGLRGKHGREPAAFFAEARGLSHHPRLGRELHTKRDELRARREGAALSRAHVKRALEKQPFDRAELERALAQVRADTAKTQELVHRTLGDVAVAASPAERSELARAFERHPRRKKR
jgi:uncharacterized membrane protein